jgi:hypothetical protein
MFHSMADLWILADKLQIPELQNHVMSKLVDLYRRHVVENMAASPFTLDAAKLTDLDAKTTLHRPLRRFFVELIAYGVNSDSIEKSKQNFSESLLKEINSIWMAIARRPSLGAAVAKNAPFLSAEKGEPYYVSEVLIQQEVPCSTNPSPSRKRKGEHDDGIRVFPTPAMTKDSDQGRVIDLTD